MSKFVQQSRYHLDDKDLFDLFSSPMIGERFLLKFAKRRGMILSNEDDRESVINYLSRQTLSWREISEIGDELNQAERDEKPTTCQLEHGDVHVDLASLLEKVKTERVQTHDEIYNIRKLASGAFDVTVTYTEINSNLSRPFQKKEKNVTLEIDPKKGCLEIQHSSADRANDVIKALAKAIEDVGKKSTQTKRIDLSHVRDAELRTKFILSIPNKIEGFRLLDIKDIKVDKRLPEIQVVKEDEDNEPGDKTVDENKVQTLQAIVRQAAFSGQNLTDSPVFQQLRAEGYFIYSLNWLGRELDGEDRNVEFCSDFTDPVNFRGFRFDVRKITTPGEERDTKIGMVELRRKYLRRLEDACYASLLSIKSTAAKTAGAA